MTFVRRETHKRIALQALLALLQHMHHRPTLKGLVHDQGNALTNLRQGDRRGPFFSRSVSRTRNHVASNESV